MPGRRAKWLAAAEGLAAMGFADTVAGRREMVGHLDQRGRTEGKRSGMVPLPPGADGRMSHLRKGWYWGRQEFAQRALALAGTLIGKGRSRAYMRNRERLAHGMEEAQRLLEEGIAVAGLKELGELPANEARKVALARLVWEKTTVSQSWIAERLKMGNAANVSLALHRAKKRRKAMPKELVKFLASERNAQH